MHGYRLESASSFSKQNGTTYDPDGKLLGASNVTVLGGSVNNESQELIIDPHRTITVRRDVSVRRDSQ